jgi:YjbE family integral membrane protein
MSFTSPEFWIALVQIIGVNIVLSGDNAVVIALAARGLPPDLQKRAVAWGSGAAVVMRIVLTIVAVELLRLPYLKLVGAGLLLWIAIQLLVPEDGEGGHGTVTTGMAAAIKTILLADLVMSLDNVIAVAAAAKGNTLLLVVGLAISIPLVVFASRLLLTLMDRFPVIITMGAALLGWVAGDMAVTDPIDKPWVDLHAAFLHWGAPLACAITVVVVGKWLAARKQAREQAAAPVVAPVAAAAAAGPHPLQALLLAVDGSEGSAHAVRQALSLRAQLRDPHFGEMGSRWGINRTVGQIYALIFMSRRCPLNADEIAEALEFSRSNVSMGLKELQAWRLVKLRHQPGDRREYFEAPEDVWEIFRTLAEERRRREIEPTLSMLRNALLEHPASDEDRIAQERMREMHDLIDRADDLVRRRAALDAETLQQLMKMGAKVQKVLEFKDRKVVAGGGHGRRPTLREWNPDPPSAGAHAVCGQHQLPHPVSHHHHRAGLGAAVLPPALAAPPTRPPGWDGLPLLDQGLRAELCAGRGQRHHHELPVRHQLAGLHGKGGQHRRAAAGLRGADRLLPGSHLPGHHAVRPRPGVRARAPAGHLPGGASAPRMSAFWILALNSWMQTPAGFRDDRRRAHVTSGGVIFNPSLPLPPDAHAAGLGLTVAFLLAGVSAWQLLRGTTNAGSTGARCAPAWWRAADPAADPGRRPARPEHAAAPARQDGGDGRHLADRARRAAAAVRLPDEKDAQQPTGDRHPQAGQPDPDTRRRRRNPRGSTSSRARTRRWRRCSGLPRDGGHRPADAGGVVVGRRWALWRRRKGSRCGRAGCCGNCAWRA